MITFLTIHDVLGYHVEMWPFLSITRLIIIILNVISSEISPSPPNCATVAYNWLVAWHSGRTSVSDRRTFAVLRSTGG